LDDVDAGLRVCRSCQAPLTRLFVDLGMSPPSEAFLTAEQLLEPETFYPLDVRICDSCLLVQLPAYVPPEEIFTEYAYFSSYSDSWVDHAAAFVEGAVERFSLDQRSRVLEIASNDGYLLQHVVARGIPALGIDPAKNVAAAAIERGIPTHVAFFGQHTAEEVVARFGTADLVVANNVYAHIPDLNDFTAGLRRVLAPGGVLSIEVQYLVRLIESVQFDTIYHEHYMYWTLHSARAALGRSALRILDVEELPTHGGSIRIWAVHEADPRPSTSRAAALFDQEAALGYDTVAGYAGFADRVHGVKRDLLTFLADARRGGQTIAGYGAPGKGNTLLNYCGIRTDFVEYLVDRNPYKHGRFTPGTHIPIFPPERLAETRPDVILILPWNLRAEIAAQLAPARDWGARLIVPIPRVEVVT
jgi:SAM-dependent methyltransferase